MYHLQVYMVIAVIEADSFGCARVGEIRKATGMPKATLYRYLRDLLSMGQIRRVRRGRYEIVSHIGTDAIRKIGERRSHFGPGISVR